MQEQGLKSGVIRWFANHCRGGEVPSRHHLLLVQKKRISLKLRTKKKSQKKRYLTQNTGLWEEDTIDHLSLKDQLLDVNDVNIETKNVAVEQEIITEDVIGNVVDAEGRAAIDEVDENTNALIVWLAIPNCWYIGSRAVISGSCNLDVGTY